MKQFACGAVVPGCHAVFRAEDVDTIMVEVAAHARDDHGLADISPELAGAVRENIMTVAA